MNILEKAREFFESEAFSTEVAMDLHPDNPGYRTAAFSLYLDNIGAVARFIQTCGVSFEDADKLYVEYRDRMAKKMG